MPSAQGEPAPQWVTSGAVPIRGLDLLGLRAPVMRIGNSLLDGITTITPSVRYMSLVTWLTWLYWRRAGKDTRKDYLAFARHVEAAIALGNLAHDPDVVGLVGAEGALEALRDATEVPLDLKVLGLAANAYAVPAEQLGLLTARADGEVPHLSVARGVPLAETVDRLLRTTDLGRRLSDGELPAQASLADLRAFGKAAHISTFPKDERRLLIDAVLPPAPEGPIERSRLATHAAFLARAAMGYEAGRYRALIATAAAARRGLPAPLDRVLNGWVRYVVRDSLAVAHEYAIGALLRLLPRPGPGGPRWLPPSEAVQRALAEPALQNLLEELGLVGPGERWEDLAFRELSNRVVAQTGAGAVEERGLCRWEGGLDEERLIGVVRDKEFRNGAPAALPVAWLLAERRAGPGVRARAPGFEALSPPREGLSRLGVEQIVLPTIERYLREDARLAQVVGDLLAWTVDQHLRTAWSRMAVDRRKDVALLDVDGNRWAYRQDMRAGQTNSRLYQVESWLRQLGLLDETGVTAEGQSALDRALATLAREDS